MFRKLAKFITNPNQEASNIAALEEEIEQKKESSPCESAMLTLMANSWVPTTTEELNECKKTTKIFENLLDSAKSKEELMANFAKIYPTQIRCFNGQAVSGILHNFFDSKAEELAFIHSATISTMTETMETIESRTINPVKSTQMKEQIRDGESIVKNLTQFRSLHFNCRTNGSPESRKKAEAHLDEIKNIANKMQY